MRIIMTIRLYFVGRAAGVGGVKLAYCQVHRRVATMGHRICITMFNRENKAQAAARATAKFEVEKNRVRAET